MKFSKSKFSSHVFFSPQVKSPINASGPIVNGVLRALMNWRDIIANIPVLSHSNASSVSEALHVPIIWHCIWNDICRRINELLRDSPFICAHQTDPDRLLVLLINPFISTTQHKYAIDTKNVTLFCDNMWIIGGVVVNLIMKEFLFVQFDFGVLCFIWGSAVYEALYIITIFAYKLLFSVVIQNEMSVYFLF